MLAQDLPLVVTHPHHQVVLHRDGQQLADANLQREDRLRCAGLLDELPPSISWR